MKIHIIQKKLKKWFHGEYIMHNISIYFDHTRKEIYYSLLYKSTHIMYFASMHYNIKGKIAKMVPKLFTRGQVHPRTFKRVNIVPQLCFLAQTCPCANVVLQGVVR